MTHTASRIARQLRLPPDRVLSLESVSGRSAPFALSGPFSSITCLWGEIRVISPELGAIPLTRGEILTWPGGPLEVAVAANSFGIVAQGQAEAIRRLGSMWDEQGWTRDTAVLNHQRAPRRMLRALVEMTRRLRRSDAEFKPGELPGFVEGVNEYRNDLGARLAMAPGRTLRQKQRCFERLLRVRLQVLVQPQRRWSLTEMAAVATYSPWHFQRAFTTVFGQSPHEFVEDVRLKLGRKLLAQAHLSIADVASAVGYESHSNFTRILKKRHGLTARHFRRRAHGGAAPHSRLGA